MSPVTAHERPVLPDPRPVVVEDAGRHLLEGGRCRACGHALVLQRPRCPRCRAAVAAARFGPGGTIWAVTVVHVAAREDDGVPYAMAYLDLDDGPRVLVRLDEAAPVGARAELRAPTAGGDPAAAVVR